MIPKVRKEKRKSGGDGGDTNGVPTTASLIDKMNQYNNNDDETDDATTAAAADTAPATKEDDTWSIDEEERQMLKRVKIDYSIKKPGPHSKVVFSLSFQLLPSSSSSFHSFLIANNSLTLQNRLSSGGNGSSCVSVLLFNSLYLSCAFNLTKRCIMFAERAIRQEREEARLNKVQAHAKQQEANTKLSVEMMSDPSKKRPHQFTLSIALPSSFIDKILLKELRTCFAGQVSRAATLFYVNEIVIYNEYSTQTE